MNQRPSPLAAFYLIGERPEGETGKAGEAGLRPALFGAYRDLSGIRYDYPLVLLRRATGDEEGDETADVTSNGDNAGDAGDYVKSLSDICDEILQEIAPRGIAGEQMRSHLLSLEQEIRSLVAGGRKGSLSQLWDGARQNLISATDKEADKGAAKALEANLRQALGALKWDGEIIDCDEQLPVKLLSHAWATSRQLKMHQLGTRIDELVQKLSNILRVDFMHSEEAHGARHLEASVGSADQTVFDFKAMSNILSSTAAGSSLPENRQQRIVAAISALKLQRFVVTANGNGSARADKAAFAFAFDNCAKALKAFRDRLPHMSELVKAISIAELEIENRYDERRHDAFFGRFDETLLGPEDLAMFPSYLVCLACGVNSASEQTALFELLRAGLPIKIVAQSDDILEDLPIEAGQLSFGTRGQQIASMAVGLGSVFVMQSAASSLYRLRAQALDGLAGDGPALFSIFSGCDKSSGETAPYLRAAAATEARAFPCFVYDPGAEGGMASRLTLDSNPQAGADWPQHLLRYEDGEHNRMEEETAFTLVDFVAADARYAGHFALVPRSDWHDGMVPASAFIDEEAAAGSVGPAARVPYVLVIDEDDNLSRAVVDEKLIEGARRCRDSWRSLQEAGGINAAGAEKLLAEAKEAWEQEKQHLLAAAKTATPAAAAEPGTGEDAGPAPATAPAAEAPEVPAGEPFIETGRCTTCNECTDINSQMFAYNEDMQAYISDPDAGTYRQLVEAAETCQVCIIHPGVPRNPDEPGLEDLIARGDAFNA